jgi:hypothetical protein
MHRVTCCPDLRVSVFVRCTCVGLTPCTMNRPKVGVAAQVGKLTLKSTRDGRAAGTAGCPVHMVAVTVAPSCVQSSHCCRACVDISGDTESISWCVVCFIDRTEEMGRVCTADEDEEWTRRSTRTCLCCVCRYSISVSGWDQETV